MYSYIKLFHTKLNSKFDRIRFDISTVVENQLLKFRNIYQY